MGSSPRKSRGRPLAPETEALSVGLAEILVEQHPMTVRGAFYQAETRGLVPKSDAGCSKVQRLLVRMREEGVIPWAWITDGTRWRRGPTTYNGIGEALRDTAELYRRDLWARADEIVEIWVEKDALSGVIQPITDEYAVDLMVTRGFPSLTYLHNAADHADDAGKPLQIYYLGDRDPSGRKIVASIEKRLTEFGCDFALDLLAVTDEQVHELDLATRPTKRGGGHSEGFTGPSVELDAIPAGTLRELVENAIVEHVDLHELGVLREYERSEREEITRIAELTA